jgi:tripartite-type tricarboxylate transporter receptor subunit TctC
MLGYGTSGGFNTYARIMANQLDQRWDVNVTVNNVTGAGGRIAREQLYNSDANGYTIMLLDGAAAPVEQAREDVDYDLNEFEYLPSAVISTNITSVANNTDVESFDGIAEGIGSAEFTTCSPGRIDPGLLGPYMLGRATGEWDPQVVLDNLLVTDGSCIAPAQRGEAQVATKSVTSVLRESYRSTFRPLIHYSLADENPYPDRAPNMQTLGQLGYTEEDVGDVINLLRGIRSFIAPPDTPDEALDVLRTSIWEVLQSDSYLDAVNEAGLQHDPVDAERSREVNVGRLEAWNNNLDLINELS